MADVIHYGVVGLGRAGWCIHVEALRQRADARIVAVADPLQQRRDEAARELDCHTYATLGPLLRRDDIEVITIATPSVRHAPDAKRILAAAKHVVVENPMALSPAQADGMMAAADRAGRKLFVHQNYRFHRQFTHFQEVIRSGLIGRLFHIRYQHCDFYRRYDWQTLSKNGGGVLNNTGPHVVDQILQVLGAPVAEVWCDLQHIVSAGDVEDHVKALIRTENGSTADMEISTAMTLDPAPPVWILCGSNGTLTSDGITSTIKWFDPKHVKPLEAIDGPVLSRTYEADRNLPWQTKTVDAIGPHVGDFYDNVAGVLRRGEPMRVTPESIREVIRVIALIRISTSFPGRPIRSGPAASDSRR